MCPLFRLSSRFRADFDVLSRFLTIEPQLDNDYNFSLSNTEGLCDLFDFDM